MSYVPCAKICWTKLARSVTKFIQRVSSQFIYDVKQCWEKSFKHCSEGCHCTFCWCRVKAIACIAWQVVKSLVCTIVRIVVLVVSVIVYFVVFFFTIVRCLSVPCSLSRAPEIKSCDDLLQNLRNAVNDELSTWDKFFGFFGTPFKETGLSNSWDEYNYWMEAKGEIVHLSYSSDGLETIDLKLMNLSAFGSETDLIVGHSAAGLSKCDWTFSERNQRFIRAEVFPQVLLAYVGAIPKVSDRIVVKGRLFWDRDGWLEIHPKFGSDLQVTA